MHMGPVFCVRTLVGSPVAVVSGDSPACDLALFAHPFVEEAASGRLQRSFIDDRQRCFAPIAAVLIDATTLIVMCGLTIDGHPHHLTLPGATGGNSSRDGYSAPAH
jgi:hypothetical protein